MLRSVYVQCLSSKKYRVSECYEFGKEMLGRGVLPRAAQPRSTCCFSRRIGEKKVAKCVIKPNRRRRRFLTSKIVKSNDSFTDATKDEGRERLWWKEVQ